ncbi:hypothetical protein TBLA_0B02260 [Henningerozyma blattae CBS 6284]|uniref:Uncharacterized protein n=1 Tax=Henningerozyma blattae (strain ATCC 34711 / CBS 6284 / DSM 70876 / NBRC 10599 / NRRL Y-10934 / UCD 77-7) TaxID=1071380 RepID=I2GY66_HENB6|nr:hypothetical protein TBLA_0B02260 [Tetrapisispora blattae CBS 6284]CCH59068.1 hypothetical protein TBLA_0B02260 [Tetrapisispora blattae CBS 6284]
MDNTPETSRIHIEENSLLLFTKNNDNTKKTKDFLGKKNDRYLKELNISHSKQSTNKTLIPSWFQKTIKDPLLKDDLDYCSILYMMNYISLNINMKNCFKANNFMLRPVWKMKNYNNLESLFDKTMSKKNLNIINSLIFPRNFINCKRDYFALKKFVFHLKKTLFQICHIESLKEEENSLTIWFNLIQIYIRFMISRQLNIEKNLKNKLSKNKIDVNNIFDEFWNQYFIFRVGESEEDWNKFNADLKYFYGERFKYDKFQSSYTSRFQEPKLDKNFGIFSIKKK